MSLERKNKAHIARFQQEIPKTIDFENYWDIYKEQIISKCKEYPVSKIKCVLKIRMQKAKLNGEYINEVFPFDTGVHVVTEGTDMDAFYKIIYKQILKSVEEFLKNGSGWSIVNLERFDIYIYEYKPFAGKTHFKFKDIKVNFKGRTISLDDKISGREPIVNMQNNDMCFKWAVMRALNAIPRNKERVTKKLKEQAKEYDWSEIPFPTPYTDKSINRFEERYKLSINVYGYRWEYNPDIEDMDILIISLRLSSMENGKEEPFLRNIGKGRCKG